MKSTDSELKRVQKRGEKHRDSTGEPRSIRTPGRTWTSYAEAPKKIGSDFQAEIESQGEVDVERNPQRIPKPLMDQIKPEEDHYTSLHASKLTDIIYIESSGEGTVDIRYTGNDVDSHVLVIARKNSNLTVKKHQDNTGNTVTVDELYLEKNSTVKFSASENSSGELSYSKRKAICHRDSKIKWLNAQFGSDLNKTDIETTLKGDNSEVKNLCVWYPTESQHVDISIQARHTGKNTKCNMKSKAAVDDKARSAYEGLQEVGNTADNTQSFQDEDVMTLSENAEIDASPKLMIEDPDVEASHAASTGSIPKTELHYLKSRGLSNERAKKLVLKGFFEPLLEDAEDLATDKIRESIDQKITGKNQS